MCHDNAAQAETRQPQYRTSGADTCTCQTYGYEGHVSVTTCLTSTRSLKLPGLGAVAHMSLHQKPTMSKNHQTCHRSDKIRRTTRAPRFDFGGLGARLCWRPSGTTLSAPRWRGAYMEAWDLNQALIIAIMELFCRCRNAVRMVTPGRPQLDFLPVAVRPA